MVVSILTLAIAGLASLFVAMPAAAAPASSPPALAIAAPAEQATEPPAAVGIVDIYFVLATVAFFKAQFGWKKWQVLVAAGVVSVVVGLGPQLQLLVPWLNGWFDAIVGIFKLLMYSAGSYDLVTNVGPKFLTSLKTSNASAGKSAN